MLLILVNLQNQSKQNVLTGFICYPLAPTSSTLTPGNGLQELLGNILGQITNPVGNVANGLTGGLTQTGDSAVSSAGGAIQGLVKTLSGLLATIPGGFLDNLDLTDFEPQLEAYLRKVLVVLKDLVALLIPGLSQFVSGINLKDSTDQLTALFTKTIEAFGH